MSQPKTRSVVIEPANDCIYGPCRVPGCPGFKGRFAGDGHGLRSERWIYVLRGTEGALVLTVNTDIDASTVPADHAARCGVIERARPLSECRYGTDLTFHERVETEGQECLYVHGRCSVGWSVASQARDVFRDFGDPSRAEPQSEAFWASLDRLYAIGLRETRAEAAENEAAERAEFERLKKKYGAPR